MMFKLTSYVSSKVFRFILSKQKNALIPQGDERAVRGATPIRLSGNLAPKKPVNQKTVDDATVSQRPASLVIRYGHSFQAYTFCQCNGGISGSG
jgi:hypothetical protein